MKRIRILTLTALLCSGLMVVACKGDNKGVGTDTASSVTTDQNDSIAWKIYQLIPKDELPDYCRNLEQMDWSGYAPEDVPEHDPTFFASSVEGHMIDGMDSGFYGRFNLKCYPLKSGGWRAYWVAYGGYDGLCGYHQSGAYNYVKGSLTREETWILPFPGKDELLSAALAEEMRESGEYDSIDQPHLNYDYSFASGEDGLLTVDLDIEYLTYFDESDDPGLAGETLPIDYRWNGERLVKLDSDGLDEVQMRAIARQLGFTDPEAYRVENAGFKTFDPETYEEDGPQVLNYVQTYAATDDLGITATWKVFTYDVAKRDLKVYDFDGSKLKPSKHDIINDWNATKTQENHAKVFLSPVVIRFLAPREDLEDEILTGYTYDSTCEGLFEPDNIFES